jgi:hypothetical protein
MESHRIQSIKRQLAPFVLICIVTMSGQTQKTADNTEFEKTVTGIEDYDLGSIRRAGDSRDAAYIPYLRGVMVHHELAATPIEAAATIALVKLGDAQQIKEVECALMSSKPGTVDYIAQNMLPEIKGWFSIREYFYMLGQDAAYVKEWEKYHTDVPSVAPPSHWAVKYLPALVPRPPIPTVSTLLDPRIPKFAKQWRIWILHHRVELERIPPGGPKGLIFSNAGCPDPKP